MDIRCPKNHEPNWSVDTTGTRRCKTCQIERVKRYQARKKAEDIRKWREKNAIYKQNYRDKAREEGREYT